MQLVSYEMYGKHQTDWPLPSHSHSARRCSRRPELPEVSNCSLSQCLHMALKTGTWQGKQTSSVSLSHFASIAVSWKAVNTVGDTHGSWLLQQAKAESCLKRRAPLNDALYQTDSHCWKCCSHSTGDI